MEKLTLDTFIGNDQVKQIIKDNITIAMKKGTAFPHTLLTGTSGCGKTSLAYIIAETMNVPIIELNCATPNPNLLNQVLRVPDKGILLLDEVHSLDPAMCESVLYRYLDEQKVYLRYGDGRIEPFDVETSITIISATNMIDKLTTPFINRHDLNLKLKSYTHMDMCNMLSLYLKSLNVSVDAIDTLAYATRYIPRHAIQFAKNIIDYATLNDLTTITQDTMKQALSNLGIDEHGLTDDDRTYIHTLYYTMNNMPTGANTIMGILNDSKKNIEQMEVYLIQEGIITKSGRGRQLTGKGIRIAMQLEQLN